MKIITRFAPSPTGLLHIGGARTALFNYIFAKKNRGELVLRIEDTDVIRSKREYEKEIIKDLEWLGIKYDAFYRQSERKNVYKNYIENLIKSERAFVSEEENADKQRKKIIRLKNPGKKIAFNDLIRGQVEFDTKELGDFVIAKSIDEPIYHLAVVIDDYEMGISHVIRAEEHISNTPRQILVQEALGIKRPTYAHLPLVLAPDRSKLKKREHGALASLKTYREEGFLPEAVVNFLSLLGWNPGDDREILGIEDIIEHFDIKKIQKGGAVFNKEKLEWLNSQYVKKMPVDQSREIIKKYFLSGKKDHWKENEELIEEIMPIVLERMKKWSDIKIMIENGELDYFFEEPKLDKNTIKWKKDTDFEMAKKHLEKAAEMVNSLKDKDFNAKIIKERIMEYADKEGRGSVLWPVRYALTGKEKTPDPFLISEILGKKETIKRWRKAIQILEN